MREIPWRWAGAHQDEARIHAPTNVSRLSINVKIDLIGRDGVIRTHDPLHPMQVRYQAALRPDSQIQTRTV